MHALSGQMHAHEEEYEGSLSTGDFLTPTDEGDILYGNGREQEVGREEEYNEEVVLPPEPMQDEYPDEFEDIGEGNLPPPPINQSKRRLGREWEIHYDGKRNRRYYFNTITGESSWKRPKS